MPRVRSNKVRSNKGRVATTPPVRVMLDSGAFSAWTRGEAIDLDEYIAYVKQHRHLLDTYINLDVIPGKKNVYPTTSEVEYAAAASLDNYLAMRDAGLSPIPVFHFGEHLRWLEKLLCTDGVDYICIGGTVGLRSSVKRIFLDTCFSALTNTSGRPVVRVHGLGIGEVRLVHRYPWFSVDNTTWTIARKFGLFVPPDLGGRCNQVYIGNDTTTGAKRRDFDYLPTAAKEHTLKWMREHLGITITDLRNNGNARAVAHVAGLLCARPADVFTAPVSDLFVAPSKPVSGTGRSVGDFRMVFATSASASPNNWLNWVLSKCGATDWLLSYHALRSMRNGGLEQILNVASRMDLNTWPADRGRVSWESQSYRDARRRHVVARLGREEGVSH